MFCFLHFPVSALERSTASMPTSSPTKCSLALVARGLDYACPLPSRRNCSFPRTTSFRSNLAAWQARESGSRSIAPMQPITRRISPFSRLPLSSSKPAGPDSAGVKSDHPLPVAVDCDRVDDRLELSISNPAVPWVAAPRVACHSGVYSLPTLPAAASRINPPCQRRRIMRALEQGTAGASPIPNDQNSVTFSRSVQLIARTQRRVQRAAHY